MWSYFWHIALIALLTLGQLTAGIQLDINDPDSIKDAAATAAYGMMTYYHGNESGQIPGKLPGTWWTGGEVFMALVQYWYWTGDTSYNDVTKQALIWQKGHNDYLPDNYTQDLGNDDQVFWGLAAMTAAELNFPEDEEVSWLALAQGVFNTQAEKWDPDTCHGGLRWQRNSWNGGYDLKNSVSNGGFFQLAARLARYTKNETYTEWAEKAFTWATSVPLIIEKGWTINDLVTVESNCQAPNQMQWSYNYGIYFNGAAYMYNLTNGDTKWKNVVEGLLNTTWRNFFPQEYGGNIMVEPCEPQKQGVVPCDGNQSTFKSLVTAWLAFTTTVMPETLDQILPKLQGSAEGAAKQCSGPSPDKICGQRWFLDKYDGVTGLREHMCALSVFTANMVPFKTGNRDQGPLTADTGGTSKGDPSAGTGSRKPEKDEPREITTGDRVGASIATVVVVGIWLGIAAFMVTGD
ncbi:glycosyl hydrolase family 76-domain-containing protein [Aspergillus transmontanensis]|uniref:Mannan endo-1,6-alpha-mannosidase n=1 Tax=Aspergillus transmontanensis TaxID=1034304 RepID=A0A5N6VW17_9EURO|nr:glycosyl hydrolase family 76-domain-containing protein [Aspergillus transmontanensis]